MVNEIDCRELVDKLASNTPPELLDIRSDVEVFHGMLPGAEHVPMEQVPSRIQAYDPERELVIYCRSGVRSYHACNFLMQNGYPNVLNLRGGIVDWAREGNPIIPYQKRA